MHNIRCRQKLNDNEQLFIMYILRPFKCITFEWLCVLASDNIGIPVHVYLLNKWHL